MPPTQEFSTMIPASHLFDQSIIAAPLDADPLVTDARTFFSCFDWSVVERGPAKHSSSGLLAPAHDWRQPLTLRIWSVAVGGMCCLNRGQYGRMRCRKQTGDPHVHGTAARAGAAARP